MPDYSIENKTREASSTGLIERLCVLYLVVWAVSPPLQYGTAFRILWIFCFLVVFTIKLYEASFVIENRVFSILLYIVFLLVMTALFDGVSNVSDRFQVVICLLFFVLYEFYKDNDDMLIMVFWVVVILCIIWNIRTIQTYSTVKNISRMLSKEFEGAEEYARQGVGGFGHVYSMVFMLPIAIKIICSRIQNQPKLKKIILAVYILTTIILIINAGYFIALILTILGIIGLISENFKTQSSKIIIFTVFGILILFVVINFDAVFGYLEDISEGTMYHSKIQDIISSVSEDDTAAVGTVYARYERYTRSIKLFLESPIWGQLTRADIGKHSQILDYFAQYGVFVGIWFCSIFTGFRKNLVRNYPDKNGFITVVFICFMAFACLNNLSYSNGVIIAWCLPGALCIIQKQEELTT